MVYEDIKASIEGYKASGKSLFTTSSFQSHSLVLLHILSRIDKTIPVYFINTGFHFPETVKFKDQVTEQFGLNTSDLRSDVPKFMQRDPDGRLLFTSDPDHCCYLNKTQPVDAILLSHDIWINGVRADQSATRALREVGGVRWLRRAVAGAAGIAAAAVAEMVPPLCVVCDQRLGGGERWLCAGCDRAVRAGVELRTKHIGLAGRGCLVAAYGLDYGPEVAGVIAEMKYQGKPGLAGYLARLLWQATAGDAGAGDVFVPVPMHPARRRERGYNQAEELAKHLAKLAGATSARGALRKVSATARQAALTREARLTNVVGSIRARDLKDLEGRRVILVDDVVTTGSTFRECALALAGHGMGDVSAWAVASSA